MLKEENESIYDTTTLNIFKSTKSVSKPNPYPNPNLIELKGVKHKTIALNFLKPTKSDAKSNSYAKFEFSKKGTEHKTVALNFFKPTKSIIKPVSIVSKP